MSDDIPSNRLLGVGIEHCGATINLRDDLIRDHDRNAELIRESLEGAHKLRKVGLSCRELAAAREIGSVQAGSGIDDQQREPSLCHHRSRLIQQLQLMIRVVRSRVRHIIQHLLTIQPEPIRHRQQPNGSKRPLCINKQTLPLSATHIKRQLTRHRQCMADLGFSCSELAKDFSDGAGFDAACEESVELL